MSGSKNRNRAGKVKDMRKLLIERRQEILGGMEQKMRSYQTDGGGSPKGDSSDLAADALDSDTAMHIAESGSSEIAEIDEALQSIENGSYGLCESCGQEIPWARLKALPYATLCVSCKERQELTGSSGKGAPGWSAVDDLESLESD